MPYSFNHSFSQSVCLYQGTMMCKNILELHYPHTLEQITYLKSKFHRPGTHPMDL